MTKTSTPEELAEALSFFPPGAVRAVERLLKRAAAQAQAAARKGTAKLPAYSGGGAGTAEGRFLAGQLSRIMRQRGMSRRSWPTLKRKAPGPDGGGGGRSFHFAHTTVGKSSTSAARDVSTGKRGGSPPPGIAAKHMAYIERADAIERIPGASFEFDRRLPQNGPPEVTIGKNATVDRSEARQSAAAAGQGYIENATKIARDGESIASFGTIGATHAERVRFWEELEAHEPHPDARFQNRLIVELPHEASAAMRLEMVRTFCEREFKTRGLPFWAVLHAPGKKNDSRNYHAHIVFSERPAKRMLDDSDGLEEWDFSIVRTKRKASGNLMRQHPFRQRKADFLRQRDAIPKLRAAFAEIANTILSREQVKDHSNQPVLYDPRSYKDMGVDVVPMRSLNRIVADKVKAGKLTVIDRDYNRGLLEAELRMAAARRDKGLVELVQTEAAITTLARTPGRAKGINRLLPSEMRVFLARPLTSSAVRLAGKSILTAKRIALSEEVMERSMRSALERVIEIADPVVIASSHENTCDAKQAAALPDVEVAGLLQAAAMDELAHLNKEAILTRRRAKARISAALNVWQDTVGPDLSSPSPIVRAAVEAEPTVPDIGRYEPLAPMQPPAEIRIEFGEHLERPTRLGTVTPAAKPAKAQTSLPVFGSPEYDVRLRQASITTSAIFAGIAKIPSLEDRVRVIDDLPAVLNRARAERSLVEKPEASTTVILRSQPRVAQSELPAERAPSVDAAKEKRAEPVPELPANGDLPPPGGPSRMLVQGRSGC